MVQNGSFWVHVAVFRSNDGILLADSRYPDVMRAKPKNKNMVMLEFHINFSVGVRVHDLRGYVHAGDPHLPQTFDTQGPGPRLEALRLSRKASQDRTT